MAAWEMLHFRPSLEKVEAIEKLRQVKQSILVAWARETKSLLRIDRFQGPFRRLPCSDLHVSALHAPTVYALSDLVGCWAEFRAKSSVESFCD